MTDPNDFGSYLQRLRNSRNLSVREAAKQAGISSPYLSQVEGGKRGARKRGKHFAPHPQILRELARVYHVPAADLFERAGYFHEKENPEAFSEEREIDRCFDFVVLAPDLKKVLSWRDKLEIIHHYEELAGRKLVSWAGDDIETTEFRQSNFKGLRRFHGTLYAEPRKPKERSLTLHEVGEQLARSLDEVVRLIENGHLGGYKDPGGQWVVDREEFRRFRYRIQKKAITAMLEPKNSENNPGEPENPEDKSGAAQRLLKRHSQAKAKWAEDMAGLKKLVKKTK